MLYYSMNNSGYFQNVKAWTTMHWLFFDPTAATCDNAVCKF